MAAALVDRFRGGCRPAASSEARLPGNRGRLTSISLGSLEGANLESPVGVCFLEVGDFRSPLLPSRGKSLLFPSMEQRRQLEEGEFQTRRILTGLSQEHA